MTSCSSAIAALLNVFSTRLGRVADRVDQLSQRIQGASPADAARMAGQLAYWHRRSLWLDGAVVLAAAGGVFTSVAALTMFVGALRDKTAASVLFSAFGFAIVSVIGALGAFLTEMLLAGRGLRADVAVGRSEAEAEAQAELPEPDESEGADQVGGHATRPNYVAGRQLHWIRLTDNSGIEEPVCSGK
jgi:hypothetical protein